MVFRNGSIVKQTENWRYEGEEVEIVSIYKYLGLYFTPKSVWPKSKELLAMQAQEAISSILRYQKQFVSLGQMMLSNYLTQWLSPLHAMVLRFGVSTSVKK